jgi:hypothetical protein
MSKFHVGDKVRVYSPNEPNIDGQTGVVDGIISDEGELYAVKLPGYELLPFAVNELRPAEIVAYTNTTVLPPAAFTDGADPAPALHAMAVSKAVDSVNHPPHYKRFPVEVINFTEQLDFNRGNAVKYLARAGHKEGVDELEDLSKAVWYVNRAIEKLKKERENG